MASHVVSALYSEAGEICVVMDGPCRLTDRTACPGLELLNCELLANPVAVADVLILNVHKTPP